MWQGGTAQCLATHSMGPCNSWPHDNTLVQVAHYCLYPSVQETVCSVHQAKCTEHIISTVVVTPGQLRTNSCIKAQSTSRGLTPCQ